MRKADEKWNGRKLSKQIQNVSHQIQNKEALGIYEIDDQALWFERKEMTSACNAAAVSSATSSDRPPEKICGLRDEEPPIPLPIHIRRRWQLPAVLS